MGHYPGELERSAIYSTLIEGSSPTISAIQKRDTAKSALHARFEREAEGKSFEERLRLSHAYQEHLDAVEAEYRRDMRKALDLAVVAK